MAGDFEDEDAIEDLESLRQRYGARIIDQVDFQRRRVRPSYAIDVAGEVTLYKSEARSRFKAMF